MEVFLWGGMSQGTLVAGHREYCVGPGQKYGLIMYAMPFMWWIFNAVYFELYGPEPDDLWDWIGGGMSDDALIEPTVVEDMFGMVLEIDDDDFWETYDMVITLPKRQYVVGPGQKYERALIAEPAEYYIAEIDEWLYTFFWIIRLFQADGTEKVLYSSHATLGGAT